MKKTHMVGLLAAALASVAYYVTQAGQSGPGAPAQGEAMAQVTLPEELSQKAQVGEKTFNAVCADCHGHNAAGKAGNGPPLIHKIYEPSHHGDMAFYMAVQNGVRAHHWRFGNMPAQEGLTRTDVDGIIAYVREVQQVNGIN